MVLVFRNGRKRIEMNYYVYDISIVPNEGWAKDITTEWLGERGFSGFDEEDGVLKGYVSEEQDEKMVNVEREVADAMSEMFGLVVQLTNKQKIRDRNWNSEWEKEPLKTIEIGGRIVVHDVRTKIDKERYNSFMDISIGVSQSFGSGAHETTSMMIEMMMEAGVCMERASVLDVGTGTGILSIVAKKLGSPKVVAVDIDNWSYENAIENLRRNGVEADVRLGEINVVSADEKFDVILSNINRNILIDNMFEFKRRIRKNGLLLLSGIVESDIDVLVEKAVSNSFVFREKKEKGMWVAMCFQQENIFS